MDSNDQLLRHVITCKDEFFKRLNREEDIIFIFTHHDADGIASGGLLARAFMRKNLPFQARVVKYITPRSIHDAITNFESFKKKFFIFSDLGSGQLKFILNQFDIERVLVLDHHEIVEGKESIPEKLLHVNPWMFGIDGARDISATGVAYYFAKAISPENVDLAPLAIIGALGDEQDVGENSSIIGLNRKILGDCKKQDLVRETVDIKISGRYTRPIHLALSATSIPYLPGLSGDEKSCKRFLERLNIPVVNGNKGTVRTISDLSKEEKSKLVSSIIEHALKYGMKPNKIRQLIGNVYLLDAEAPNTCLRDMREYAALLNSCGRMGHGGIGLNIVVGDRGEFLLKGQKLVNEYTKRLANYMNWIFTTNALRKQENTIQVVDGNEYIEDTMLTTLTLLLMSSRRVDKKLPIVGWTALREDDSVVKISARGFENLVKQGLHLGQAFREIIKDIDVDSVPRGHAPAASVEIPRKKLEKFLRFLVRKTNAQINQGLKPLSNLSTWL
ncbi:hypothetical protein GF325_16835 [Candidatus Bathyarchaeota archaeon]|nr:hypothetical protein [Candidatus Bathyarchaeota archaeon]